MCVALIVAYNFIKEFIESQRFMQYDFVLGVSVIRDEFTTDHYLYGYKNGNMNIIGNKRQKDMTNVYRVTGTNKIATYFDYDPRSEITKKFFATVQNKLRYAVHEQTAAELIYNRVDNEKPYVGMTNFKGNYVTIDDVKIAKNYLLETELQRLNLLVSQFLDFVELQALEQRTMKMNDWIEELDNQILLNRRKILECNDKITHEEATKKAEKEFQIYREREMKELQSDFDLLMKSLPAKKDGIILNFVFFML